jgi:hypothetical protein
MMLETIWPEEKREGRVSSFVSTVILYRISENMTGTDKDETEIHSLLLVSFCCENSVVPYFYPANSEKL